MKRHNKHGAIDALFVTALIFVVAGAAFAFWRVGEADEAVQNTSNVAQQTNILPGKFTEFDDPSYANVSNRDVKTFSDCKDANGITVNKTSISSCYFEEVQYYEPVKGHEYLNPPRYLRTYSDCIRPSNSINISKKDLSCTSWNGKTYFYTGPPVTTFEDCVRVVGFVLESNPPQCTGPDGTHFFGSVN